MAKKKTPPNKSKTPKPKKATASKLEKALKSLPPAEKDLQKVLDGKTGYAIL